MKSNGHCKAYRFSNHLIRVALVLVDLIPSAASAQGVITTVVGGGGLTPGLATAFLVGQLTAVAVDRSGNVFFASDSLAVVYEVNPSGQLSIAAGRGPGFCRGWWARHERRTLVSQTCGDRCGRQAIHR